MVLLSDNGLDTLMLMQRRTDRPNQVLINDCINGQWGEELSLSMPVDEDNGSGTIWMKFNGTQIEIWTLSEASTFARFGDVRRKVAKFIRLNKATHPGQTLISGIERLDTTLARIETHILNRRLDMLERQLTGAAHG